MWKVISGLFIIGLMYNIIVFWITLLLDVTQTSSSHFSTTHLVSKKSTDSNQFPLSSSNIFSLGHFSMESNVV